MLTVSAVSGLAQLLMTFTEEEQKSRPVGPPHVVPMSFVFVIGPTERAILASYTMYRYAFMTNAQEPTANQNWLYGIGYHYIQFLMHIPRLNISLMHDY